MYCFFCVCKQVTTPLLLNIYLTTGKFCQPTSSRRNLTSYLWMSQPTMMSNTWICLTDTYFFLISWIKPNYLSCNAQNQVHLKEINCNCSLLGTAWPRFFKRELAFLKIVAGEKNVSLFIFSGRQDQSDLLTLWECNSCCWECCAEFTIWGCGCWGVDVSS